MHTRKGFSVLHERHPDALPRFEADAPGFWPVRSQYLLDVEWEPSQRLVAEALASVGLGWPIAASDVGATLERLAIAGADEVPLDYREADGSEWTADLPGTGPIIEVIGAEAVAMTDATHCRESDAVSFLLANRAFVLPWIVVQAETNTPFGLRYHVFVASSEAQAEEVREAAAHASDVFLGTDRVRRPAPGAMALIMHDAMGARQGLPVADRHRTWITTATDLGFKTYDTREGYRTYWNQVRALVRKYPMLREMWQGWNPGAPAPGITDEDRELEKRRVAARSWAADAKVDHS
jgi:hypothetical protein